MVTELDKNPVTNIVNELFPSQYDLIPGVNQIYELNFAASELKSLSKDELIRRSAYLRLVDGEESYHYQMCKNSILDLNKSSSIRLKTFMQMYQFKTAYATHGLFPYRGKFHPQMIKALINLIGIKEDEVLLDPMMGSGTTNIEASIMGIDSIGLDISPFCVLMVNSKINGLFLDPEPLKDCIANSSKIFEYLHAYSEPLFGSPSLTPPKELPFLAHKKYVEYLQLCYLDGMGYASRRKNKDAGELFPSLLTKYFNVLNAFSKARKELKMKVGKARIFQGDARDLKTYGNIEDSSIGGIVTSPPYSFAIDYLKGDKSQLEFLGINLEAIRDKMIGLRGDKKDLGDKVTKYLEDMTKVMGEMHRVLKENKYAVIVIGTNASQLQKIAEYTDRKVKLEDEIVRIAREVGLSLSQRISRPIEGIRNSIRNEEIIFFRK